MVAYLVDRAATVIVAQGALNAAKRCAAGVDPKRLVGSNPRRRDRRLAAACEVGLIRFRGHVPKGGYDVDHDGHEGQAVASEHYGGGDIRAKAAVGFRMYAASGRAAAFVRRGGSVLHEGAPRLTVPEHPRLLPRFLQSLRCPLVGQASLARRRRVQLLSGQEFSYGQDLDAGMLAPR